MPLDCYFDCLAEKCISLLDRITLKFYSAHVLREVERHGETVIKDKEQKRTQNDDALGQWRIKQEKGSGGF